MDEFERDFESLKKKMEIAFNEYIYLYHNRLEEMVEDFNNFVSTHTLQDDVDYIKRALKHNSSEMYIGEAGADLIIKQEIIKVANSYISKVNRAMEMGDDD